MSKMDALRAMREARYAEMTARASAPAASRQTAARPPVAPPAAKKTATPKKATPVESTETTEALCGHRNMSGRTCTREQGHAAKSHRYS
jgi:hypothetical protein